MAGSRGFESLAATPDGTQVLAFPYVVALASPSAEVTVANPASAAAHQWHGEVLVITGRLAEAAGADLACRSGPQNHHIEFALTHAVYVRQR